MIFFWLLTVIALAGAIAVTAYRMQMLSQAESATGTVIGFNTSISANDGRTATVYSPVIEFTTTEGERLTYSPNTSSSRQPGEVGDTVNLLYDPADPNTAVINTFWQKWFGSMIAALLTVVFGAVAVFVTRLARSGEAPEPPVSEPPPDGRNWIIRRDGPADAAS